MLPFAALLFIHTKGSHQIILSQWQTFHIHNVNMQNMYKYFMMPCFCKFNKPVCLSFMRKTRHSFQGSCVLPRWLHTIKFTLKSPQEEKSFLTPDWKSKTWLEKKKKKEIKVPSAAASGSNKSGQRKEGSLDWQTGSRTDTARLPWAMDMLRQVRISCNLR